MYQTPSSSFTQTKNIMKAPIKVSVQIKIISWLRIWWSTEWIEKWWTDNPIIRNPRTLEPYIPGSSVKGRMRALIEMQKYPEDIIRWSSIQKPEHIVAKSFGCAIPTKIASRLIFSDFVLSPNSYEEFANDPQKIIEIKTEVSLPRHLETAWSWPRKAERIVPWMIFDGSISMIPYEWQYAISEQELKQIIVDWMKLIEQTYLWWYGSRGCGQVKFICPALWFTETESPE